VPSKIAFLSLENDILPTLCAEGRLGGRVYEGDFIDIGVPESYAQSQTLLAGR
jgi:NDP-sugar pyrophosphorylase family protein